ncbi:MAG: hypothetical protein AAF208_11350, partial [Cyanobacteria bacterium P01_A01_bin.45]
TPLSAISVGSIDCNNADTTSSDDGFCVMLHILRCNLYLYPIFLSGYNNYANQNVQNKDMKREWQ